LVNGSINSKGPGCRAGDNRYQSLDLTLKPKLRIAGAYPYGNATLQASLEGVEGNWFPQVGLSYRVASNWQLGLAYETRFGSAEISLHHANYFISLGSQSLNLSQSRAISASAGLSYEF
jgi:hypothetical protein